MALVDTAYRASIASLVCASVVLTGWLSANMYKGFKYHSELVSYDGLLRVVILDYRFELASFHKLSFVRSS